MKIRLLSDLHLEGRQGYHKVVHEWAQHLDDDVLVLAGDIAVGPMQVQLAIEYFKRQGFPEIIFVPGNHELYHHSRKDFEMLKIHAKRGGAHVLDASEVIRINDVSFFGGTMWTNFHDDHIAKLAAARAINDFKVIEEWSVDEAYEEFQRQIGFIKAVYRQTEGKKVIVTHFLPAMECVHERWKSAKVDFLLNKYFAANLSEWISTLSDTTWLFGHTHDPTDIMIGDTRLVCNPLGYSGEPHKDFDPFKQIEI